MSQSRNLAAQALLRVEEDGAFSNIIFGNLLDKENLNKSDKALASAIFYGVLDRKITLDFYIGKLSKIKVKKIEPLTLAALRIGLYQICFMERIPKSAAVNESVNIVKNTREERNSGFINAVLRSAVKSLPNLPVGKDLFSLSVRYSCPVHIISQFINDYGIEKTEEIIKAFLIPSKVNLCVNTLKASVDQLSQLLREKGIEVRKTNAKENLITVSGIEFINNPLFDNGYFFIQDTASNNCAKALMAKKHERILDVCAAPGGKTFTVALNIEDIGEIMSCDLYENRVALIKSGAERLGLRCIKTTVNDATVYNAELGDFDAVLCDVPCSGYGVIGRKPEIKYKKITDFTDLEKIQQNILNVSAEYVKKGGRLVYSTCTLRKAENEEQVKRFLCNNKDFICQYMHTDLPSSENDGFFHALLIKK